MGRTTNFCSVTGIRHPSTHSTDRGTEDLSLLFAQDTSSSRSNGMRALFARFLSLQYARITLNKTGFFPPSTDERCRNSFCRYDLELHVIHLSSHGEIAVIGIVYTYGRPDPFLTKVQRLLYLALLTAPCALIRAAAASVIVLAHRLCECFELDRKSKVELVRAHFRAHCCKCIICLIIYPICFPYFA